MQTSGVTEAFFLEARDGQRFCLYYPAAGAARGAVLYIHPFAEEMNKSRRMAALQARALAASGYAVLQIDLLGCGDSAGDFADARWDSWKQDLALAQQWLSERVPGPLYLWGLRLGALLACDYAQTATVAGLLLWQPVQNGKQFMTQFLRLKVASAMIVETKDSQSAGAGPSTNSLRAQLAAGEALEVAGYTLAPALVAAIDGADLAALTPPKAPVHWFEVVPAPDRPLPPVAARQVQAWRTAGVTLNERLVAGQAFWTTQEIMECAELLQATTEALAVP